MCVNLFCSFGAWRRPSHQNCFCSCIRFMFWLKPPNVAMSCLEANRRLRKYFMISIFQKSNRRNGNQNKNESCLENQGRETKGCWNILQSSFPEREFKTQFDSLVLTPAAEVCGKYCSAHGKNLFVSKLVAEKKGWRHFALIGTGAALSCQFSSWFGLLVTSLPLKRARSSVGANPVFGATRP